MKIINILENDYIFSILNRIASILVGLFTSVVVNRYLGPELKGQYIYIINIVNIVVIIANLGFFHSYPNQKRQNMTNQIERYLNVFSLQAIIYFLIVLLIGIFNTNLLFMCSMFLIPIQIISNQLSIIVLVEHFRYRQKIQFFAKVITLGYFLIIFLFVDKKIIYLLEATIMINIIIIVLFLIKIKYIPKPFKIEYTFICYLIKFGLFAMVSELLITLNYKIDVIIMRKFIEYKEIGLYSIGASLAEYAWLIPDAFKDVLYSKTAKSDSVNEIVFSIKISLFITMVCLFGILIFGKLFIIVLYGKLFADAYVVTCIIFMGIPSMVLYKLIGPLYMANGENKFYAFSLLISVLLNVILNIILIPILGKNGAALSSVFSYTVCGMIFYVKFITRYKIKWYTGLIINHEDYDFLRRKFRKII